MAHAPNSLFDKMVDDAMDEVADKGWRAAGQNAVTLAASGMLNRLIKNHISDLKKPLYWVAGAIIAAVISFIINNFLGG